MKHPDGRAWTQDDARRAIGTSLRSYSAWERGDATPQAHWNAKMDEVFADVARPAAIQPPTDTTQIRQRLTEILAEALTLVTQLDRHDRPAEPTRWAARAREVDAPERVQWLSADAPSAHRDKGSGAGSAHVDEAR